MIALPPRSISLSLPVPELSGEQALRAAEQSLLASRQAARRALEVISAYEARHGEEPLSR
ncbi:MAG: hypothetical protein ABJC62_08515 [Frankiaceae bacterium]|jgi:hypothetical protein